MMALNNQSPKQEDPLCSTLRYNYFCGGDMHVKTTYFAVMDRSGNCALKGNQPNHLKRH